MGIEQRLAEIIRAFHADTILGRQPQRQPRHHALRPQGPLAALGARLPGYAAATPDTLQRRFLQTPGEIITTGDTITVRLDRRASDPSYVKPPSQPPRQCPGGATEPSVYEYA